MKITTTILAACLCVTLVNSVPLKSGFQSQALDRLMVDETVNDSAMRSKRTIGILRQLFPDLTKMIEDKVNAIVGELIKIFGPVVFNSILGNRNGAGGNADGGSKSTGSTVNAKNPFDDDDTMSFTDDDDWFNSPAQSDNGNKVSFELPTVKSVEPQTSSTTVMSVEEPSSTSVKTMIEDNTTTRSNEDDMTTQTDDSATNSVL